VINVKNVNVKKRWNKNGKIKIVLMM